MKKSQMIVAALIVYLALLVSGGVVYLVLSHPEKVANLQAKISGRAKTGEAATAETKEKELLKQKELAEKKLAEEEAAKKLAEEEKRKAKEQEEAAKTKREAEENASRERRMENLIAGMNVKKRGNSTFYRYIYDTYPESGVYLRPFLVDGGGFVILKSDIYYYSSLGTGDFRWVYGDYLQVSADGVNMVIYLDGSKRRDKLGKGAEDLTESYVYDADTETLNVLRAIGNSSDVWVSYANGSSGTASGRSLGREEIRRIHNMVELYDLFMQEYT